MSDTLVLALEGGEQAELVESDGERVVLIATRAYPPGATLSGVAAGLEAPFLVKVRGSKRREDGRFRVEGRHVNLSRAQRQRLIPGSG